jgi:hypothetical protein
VAVMHHLGLASTLVLVVGLPASCVGPATTRLD